MSNSKLTTKKIKKITKADGKVICLNNYLAYRKHKNNYNYWCNAVHKSSSYNDDQKEKMFEALKNERLNAIESYNLAFCLN